MRSSSIHSRKSLVAGIELGGTKSIALLAHGSEIVELTRLPTELPSRTLPGLAAVLADWSALHGAPSALGIASFGPIGLDPARADFGRILATPKEGWAGADVRGFFADRFSGPIGFDTDVNGAALAEYSWGAARDCKVVVYITVGTGVGGGVLVDGKPLHGAVHPEIGHLRIRRTAGDRFAGTCSFHGDCLEGLISGPALAARRGILGDAIDDDDPLWEHVASDLSEALALLLLTLSPDRILIGGGVLDHRSALLPKIRARTAELLGGYAGSDAHRMEQMIKQPALGSTAGPLGAAALALRAV